ncbi:MAG: DUF726 domain-containing protein [Desulfovibrionaceae bacterium]|nr:DUF726 domain-containing protein [Desulfovibrionaceae bacterium]
MFKTEINGVGAEVHTLREAENGVVDVLIHGYTAVTREKDLELFQKSAALLPEATVLLLHWDAGNAVNETLRSAAQYAMEGPCRNVRRARPYFWLADALLGGVKGIADSFSYARKRADRLAEGLADFLPRMLRHRVYARLNLVGHSLGARILVQWLKKSTPPWRVGDVVLMGAAISWPREGLRFPQAGQRLFNLYSEKDTVLRLPQRECLGRVGLPGDIAQAPGVVQMHCLGFGHRDYWPALGSLSLAAGFLRAGESPWLHLAEKVPMHELMAGIEQGASPKELLLSGEQKAPDA